MQIKNIKTLNVWGGDKKKINIFSKDEIKITIPKKIKKQLSFAIKISISSYSSNN